MPLDASLRPRHLNDFIGQGKVKDNVKIAIAAAKGSTKVIFDEDGHKWQIAENALESPSGERLSRLPGHMAYWFGWFSFYPKTAVYGVKPN